MLELAELIAKLLDAHPGGAVTFTLVVLYLVYTQADMLINIRAIRKRLATCVTEERCEMHRLENQNTLLVQAQALSDSHPTLEQVVSLIKVHTGKSNGHSTHSEGH